MFLGTSLSNRCSAVSAAYYPILSGQH